MKEANKTVNYHLDKSVILFFVIAIMISASLFAYKFVNYQPCEVVEFEYETRELRAGEIIRFKDKTRNVQQRRWDFGDSSKTDVRLAPYHTYDKPGNYTVKLMINGRCEGFEVLKVKEKVFILDSTKIANFDLPEKIKIGEKLKVIDKTIGATSWEWRFGETAKVNSTEKNPEYVYQTEGTKTVTLIVNGDPRYGTKRKITVLPNKKKNTEKFKSNKKPKNEGTSKIPYKPNDPIILDFPLEPETDPEPDEPEIEEVKAPYLGKKQFLDKIMMVSKKKAQVADFRDYLCDKINLPIKVNGKKKIPFNEFCGKIRGKGIKISELKIDYHDNNCIKNIEIKYHKTSIF